MNAQTSGPNGTLSIMSALAVEVAFRKTVLPTFEAESGIKTDVLWEPTTVLMKRIADGARADVIIAIDASMDKLAEEGIVVAPSRVPIAQAVLGVAVAGHAAHPDISTLDAFKNALLEARSIALSQGGASGIYFRKLVEDLGIADAVSAKAVTIPSGFTATKIVSGEAEMAIQQLSELMSVDGIDILGPFPPEVQSTTDFSAAIFADARSREDAERFLKHLTDARASKAYGDGGLVSRVKS